MMVVSRAACGSTGRAWASGVAGLAVASATENGDGTTEIACGFFGERDSALLTGRSRSIDRSTCLRPLNSARAQTYTSTPCTPFLHTTGTRSRSRVGGRGRVSIKRRQQLQPGTGTTSDVKTEDRRSRPLPPCRTVGTRTAPRRRRTRSSSSGRARSSRFRTRPGTSCPCSRR